MPVKIVCETSDAASGKIEARRDIDHGNPELRLWLQRYLHWALRNGKRVTIYPAKGAGRKKCQNDE